MIYLYIKQHNKSKLKYFGKTTKNPYVYNGSGVKWIDHCNKHGLDDIETLEVFKFKSLEEASEFAIKFSIENNIVESKDWANLIIEDAKTGGDMSNCDNFIKAMKNRNQVPWNKGLKTGPHTEESNKQRSETLKEHWKVHGHNRIGVNPWNKGVKGQQVAWNKGKKEKLAECPHCGKTGGHSNMKRWHFDNCKKLVSASTE